MQTKMRQAIIASINAHTDYDASSVIIHKDGTISARRDANKTYCAPETMRYLVGHVSDYLDSIAK